MENTIKTIIVSAVTAFVVVFGLYVTFFHPHAKDQAAGTVAAGITNLSGLSIDASDEGPGTLDVAATTTVSKGLSLGGSTLSTSITEVVSVGSCTAASSTAFAVANPFGATSTATLIALTVTGNATTTTLLVGTSTKSTGLAASDISASFVNATVSTSTAFYTASGIRAGSGSGYLDPGAASLRSFVVGASQYVAGEATTTATGAGAAQFSPGYSSCTYKIRWTQ